MRKRGLETIYLLCLSTVLLTAGRSWGLELQSHLQADMGLDVEWVGQRYRLIDEDTLDQFNETRMSVSLGYGGDVERGLWLQNDIALSDHTVKNLLTTAWAAPIPGAALVRLENQLEIKDYWWRGKDLFGSGYLEDRLRLEGRWPLGKGLRLEADQRFAYVDYKKSTSYFRDYWLSESSAQLDVELGLMWDLALDYTLTRRDVPDTSGMDYVSHSLRSSLGGLLGWSFQMHFDGQVERRHSDQSESHQNYWNLASQGELEYQLGSAMGLVFRGELEQMAHDRPDEIYYDFWQATGKLGLSHDFSMAFSATLLPMYSRSKAIGTSIGETYHQRGVELDLDYSGSGRWWASMALELGIRNYESGEENDFYSSYVYVHPTLLLNVRLSDDINLDLFVDHDPEWHKQREDDFATSLISCSLNYHLR